MNSTAGPADVATRPRSTAATDATNYTGVTYGPLAWWSKMDRQELERRLQLIRSDFEADDESWQDELLDLLEAILPGISTDRGSAPSES